MDTHFTLDRSTETLILGRLGFGLLLFLFFPVLSQAEGIQKEKDHPEAGTPTHEVAQMVAKNSSDPKAYISVAQR